MFLIKFATFDGKDVYFNNFVNTKAIARLLNGCKIISFVVNALYLNH